MGFVCWVFFCFDFVFKGGIVYSTNCEEIAKVCLVMSIPLTIELEHEVTRISSCKPFNIIAFITILGFELFVVQKTNFWFLKIKPVVIIFETAGQSILNDIPNTSVKFYGLQVDAVAHAWKSQILVTWEIKRQEDDEVEASLNNLVKP